MTYNLTEKQKELARWLVEKIRADQFGETFYVIWRSPDEVCEPMVVDEFGKWTAHQLGKPGFEALAAEGLVRVVENEVAPFPKGFDEVPTLDADRITITGRLFRAVEENFAESTESSPLSTLAHATPPELNLSLDRLRKKYPDPAKLGFLVMRFTPGKPFSAIVKAIKDTAMKHGIFIIRADEEQFHSELWSHVRTFLHGCSFGVAVFERIEQEEPNANVGLEIGYLLAMNKPVLLLKERTVKTLQADLMGRLYKEFDEHDPAGTIPDQLERWLTDNGVIVS